MVSEIDSSLLARMASRTAWWPWSVQAHIGFSLAVAQQLEVPAAVHRVAVQAGADQLVVLDHQLLVDAAERVGHHDLLAALAAHELAGGEQIDAGHLELGGRHRARVAADAELRQV